MEKKCPECGGIDFIVSVDTQFLLNVETNFGNMKYDWIKTVTCANMACSHVLEDGVLRQVLINQLRQILDAMKSETLLVK